MPPRKRKGTAAKPPAEEPKPDPAAEDGRLQLDEATKQLVMDKLADMERSVEEQCEAIRQAAREAVDAYKQEVQLQLVALPKKVRDTPFVEVEAALNNSSGSSRPSTAATAAAAAQQQLQAAQDTALQSITAAAPGTRSTRSTRARTGAGAAAPAAAPTDSCRTTRRTAARSKAAAAAAATPVPKFAEAPTSSVPAATAAADAIADDAPGGSPPAVAVQQQQPGPRAGFASSILPLAAIPEDEVPESPPAGTSSAAAAPGPAAGAPASGALQDRLASAAARAQARIDAKLASIGGTRTVGTKTAGGGIRAPQPGEACFSRNGSPLSVLLPNVTRTRGRAGRGPAAGAGASAMPSATPSAAAADGGAMLGSFTIVHKPAAQQPRGRGRRAAGAPAEGSENANPNNAAIVITTKDGTSFSVDAAAPSLEAVPARYRGEVEQQLRLLQDLASRALAATH